MLTGSTLSGHLRTDTAMISTSHFPQKHRKLWKEGAEKVEQEAADKLDAALFEQNPA